MLVGTAWQLLAYGLGHLCKGHLDARTTYRAEMSLQPFVLLTLHHKDIFLATVHGDKRAKDADDILDLIFISREICAQSWDKNASE